MVNNSIRKKEEERAGEWYKKDNSNYHRKNLYTQNLITYQVTMVIIKHLLIM